jgi:hypothetical protein
VAKLTTREPLVHILDSLATYPSIAPSDSTPRNTAFSFDDFVFRTDPVPLPDTLRFTLLVYSKPTGFQGKDPAQMILASNNVIAEIAVEQAAANAQIVMVSVKPRLQIQASDTTLYFVHRVKNNFAEGSGGVTASDITVSIVNFDRRLIERVVSDTVFTYLTLDPNTATTRDSVFVFKTKTRFLGRENPSIAFRFSWKEGKKTKIDTVFHAWKELSSFTMNGRLKSFGRSLPIKNAAVILESGTSFRAVSTDNAGSFTISNVTEAGQYKLSITHAGVPQGAITSLDADSAEVFAPPALTKTGARWSAANPLNAIYSKIAANVNGGGDITTEEADSIREKINNPCYSFGVGKPWAFIDAAAPLTAATFFSAPEHIAFTLQNFEFDSLNFVGILYGDVDGSVNPDTTLENTAACPKDTILGVVNYFHPANTPIVEAVVRLQGARYATDTTDANGAFSFPGLLRGLSYKVSVTTNESIPSRIIRSSDLTKLEQVFIAEDVDTIVVDPTTNLFPFETLAADVNVDTLVDPRDRQELIEYLASPAQSRARGSRVGTWAFFADQRSLQPLLNNTALPFKAIVLGNVDTQWPDESLFKLEETQSRTLHVHVGELFKWPFTFIPEKAQAVGSVEIKFAESQLELVELKKKDQLAKVGKNLFAMSFSDSNFAAEREALLAASFKALGAPGDTCEMYLESRSRAGLVLQSETVRINIVQKIPERFFLSQNYPNPFNPTTTIAYGLAKEARAELHILDVLGRRVCTLVDKLQAPGYYRVVWQGRNAEDQPVPSGLYFVRLRAGDFIQNRKTLLLK